MKIYRIANIDIWRLISKAHDVTSRYTQNWGDCYKVNSTVVNWLNSKTNSSRFKIAQIKAYLDKEIDDEGTMTDEPTHVVAYDTVDDEIYDFSSVLGDANMVDYEVLSYLGGEVDPRLREFLDLP